MSLPNPNTEWENVNLRSLLKKVAPDRPELIYAFEKTGRIVTEQNKGKLTPEEIKEWEDAALDYFRKKKTIALYFRVAKEAPDVSR